MKQLPCETNCYTSLSMTCTLLLMQTTEMALSMPIATSSWPRRMCACGFGQCLVKISISTKNPSRAYYVCPCPTVRITSPSCMQQSTTYATLCFETNSFRLTISLVFRQRCVPWVGWCDEFRSESVGNDHPPIAQVTCGHYSHRLESPYPQDSHWCFVRCSRYYVVSYVMYLNILFVVLMTSLTTVW